MHENIKQILLCVYNELTVKIILENLVSNKLSVSLLNIMWICEMYTYKTVII